MSAVRCTIGALALLAACGDNDDGYVGFPDGGGCWPIEATPGGDVEMGTGDITFTPMPETLVIAKNTSQSDPYLEVHSRIRGFLPGDIDDPFNPRNPRTKARAVIEELGLTLGVDCPASIGYRASPVEGAYDLKSSLRLGFGMFPIDQVNGKQIRITLEVVGSNLRYAKDERVVTLMVPPPPPPPPPRLAPAF